MRINGDFLWTKMEIRGRKNRDCGEREILVRKIDIRGRKAEILVRKRRILVRKSRDSGKINGDSGKLNIKSENVWSDELTRFWGEKADKITRLW